MADLAELLHDEIDREEELRARARTIANEVMEDLYDLVGEAGSFEAGLEAASAILADRLAELTTEAAQAGAADALRRKRK